MTLCLSPSAEKDFHYIKEGTRIWDLTGDSFTPAPEGAMVLVTQTKDGNGALWTAQVEGDEESFSTDSYRGRAMNKALTKHFFSAQGLVA